MKIVLIMAVLLLLLGTAALVASRSVVPVDEEDAEFEAEHQAKPGAYDAKSAPVFVQLETFTANLADRDSDRFIQVGVTLEVVDPKAAEQIKAFMPVIRNNILLVLTNKTSDAVREPVGKRRLAAEIRAQALRPLGHSVKVEELLDEEPSGSFRQAKWARLPIKAVHFSTFIVQ